MNAVVERVLGDLGVLGDQVEGLVAGLAESDWATPTPAPGWSIAHQVAHLAWTDEAAVAAATDPAAWDTLVRAALADPAHFVDTSAAGEARATGRELLARWRGGRTTLAAMLRSMPDGSRLPWFGPPMSPASMATARYMETWAHGLDIADAVGATLPVDQGLRHVAHLGVRTRDFAFAVRGMPPPAEEFRVELAAPSGDSWSWGPPTAAQLVQGPAYDFCLLVTQRRHRDDLALVATGEDADRWLGIAQAFAGPPGPGREPRHG